MPASCVRRRVAAFTKWGLAAALTLVVLAGRLDAAAEVAVITGQTAGAKPFISFVSLHLADVALLDYVQFTIEPKPGSPTRAVCARYSTHYLFGRGYINPHTGTVTVPVFGLYADYTNTVKLLCGFVDGTTQADRLSITTAKYNGGIYNHPVIVQAHSAAVPLSYDFIMMKDYAWPDDPMIIDTDGEIRWVGTADTGTAESILFGNSFFIAYEIAGIARMEWDGTVTLLDYYVPIGDVGFDHNFDFGKTGIITGFDTPDYVDSVNMEVDTSGNILHTWNLADIISAAMIAGGDNPALFVPPSGELGDWFHHNSAAYRPSDDSIVISSRENFVIALDYESGAIKWILGDPTKQWYQFPSLRKYALTATPGTHYPIGQHSVSFVNDRLLLFDDGYGSVYHMPAGKTRTYSAPRKYVIDQAAGTADEVWNYLATPSIFSPIVSSVYEDAPANYLVDYGVAGPYLYAELIGLAPSNVKAFDFKFTELDDGGGTAWNSVPLHMENLVFN